MLFTIAVMHSADDNHLCTSLLMLFALHWTLCTYNGILTAPCLRLLLTNSDPLLVVIEYRRVSCARVARAPSSAAHHRPNDSYAPSETWS